MPIFNYIRRLFGMNDSDSPNNSSPHQRFDPLERRPLDLDVREYQQPVTPFGNDQFFEDHISQLENFLRNFPPFGFTFGFGSPDSSHNEHHEPPHHPVSPFGPSQPDSGGFPFFGFPSIFEFGDRNKGIFGPSMEDEQMSPRDEVLKPSYRSSNRHEFKDEDYDDLVKEKGPEVILDMLRKSEEADKIDERRIMPAPDMAPKSFGSFSSTKFSFVNGVSVQEQITRLPDGTYEKRVTRTDSSGETNTIVSHHTQEEIAPSMKGGFSIFGGFGPSSLW